MSKKSFTAISGIEIRRFHQSQKIEPEANASIKVSFLLWLMTEGE